jgi:hypothetical protein
MPPESKPQRVRPMLGRLTARAGASDPLPAKKEDLMSIAQTNPPGHGKDGSVVLFEQQQYGFLWRLEVTTHKGRTFANWRKWFRDGDAWKPTKQGVVIPLDRLGELSAALSAYVAGMSTELG